MKKLSFAVLVLTLLCFLSIAPPAHAQNGAFAPYVDAGISVSSTVSGTGGLTASNPDYRLGLGVESSSSHFLLDLNGQFDSQNVRTFGFGANSSYMGTINGSGYFKLGPSVLVGGGVRWSDQITGGNLKGLIPSSINQLQPFVGGGFQLSHDRFLANYILPGRNEVAGQREIDFHNEIFLGTKGVRKHIRLTQDVNWVSSTPAVAGQTLAQRITGSSAGVGVKFVF